MQMVIRVKEEKPKDWTVIAAGGRGEEEEAL